MDHIDPKLLEIFFDVQRGLPRQGIGDSECTRKAFALCSELPEQPAILDIGCGPGMQTIVLAESSSGKITAIDNCNEYLDELRSRAIKASLSHRIKIRNADMTALDFPEESFDLIWCEGAIYNMGVLKALKSWRPLLRNQGYLVFSDMIWLDEQATGEVAEYFSKEYPAMTSIQNIINTIQKNDYKVIGDFALPESAWWDDYYSPLEAKLPSLKQKYKDNEAALGVITMSEAEIDVRRRFASSYGYHFFVAKKID